MVKKILIIATLFNCVLCLAQDKAMLEERANNLYRYFIDAKHDSLISYMHSSLFKNVSVSDYRTQLTRMTERGTKMINVPPNFNFGEIKQIDNTFYCIFYFDQTMSVAFDEIVPEKDYKMIVDMYKEYLGAEKGIFNKRKNSLFLNTRVKVVAVAEKGNAYRWLFFAKLSDKKIRENLGL
jgi:hypothetical protein